MSHRIFSAIFVALPLLAATPALAHDEFRIIGTITKQEPKALQVKTKDGKTLSVALNGETYISRQNKKVAAAELKTGGSVVVDALGDSEDDLVAVEVRIVPALAR